VNHKVNNRLNGQERAMVEKNQIVEILQRAIKRTSAKKRGGLVQLTYVKKHKGDGAN